MNPINVFTFRLLPQLLFSFLIFILSLESYLGDLIKDAHPLRCDLLSHWLNSIGWVESFLRFLSAVRFTIFNAFLYIKWCLIEQGLFLFEYSFFIHILKFRVWCYPLTAPLILINFLFVTLITRFRFTYCFGTHYLFQVLINGYCL
jgi:hypothetical protein